ncbi:MAG: hypothetical protein Q8T04_16515, partial [Bacteroidota bacterium]|nr:hypothetical protein [Bacteroidota bacterium]
MIDIFKIRTTKSPFGGFRGLLLFFFLFSFSSIAAPTQKQTLFLSGTDNTLTKTWEFFCTSGRNSGVWSKIEVPSHWEQQGFGEYDYGR